MYVDLVICECGAKSRGFVPCCGGPNPADYEDTCFDCDAPQVMLEGKYPFCWNCVLTGRAFLPTSRKGML